MVQIVNDEVEETYGKLLLAELFRTVWFGDWDSYDAIISGLPEELTEELPFHQHYNREDTALWRDNYFQIPGPYFVPPYYSSYFEKSEEGQEAARQEVLCLVGEFDKLGFYYPLEQNEFPDHFGSMTAFITAALKEEIKAIQARDTKLKEQLQEVQHRVYTSYIKKGIIQMLEDCDDRLSDPFFQAFMPFFAQRMKDIAG